MTTDERLAVLEAKLDALTAPPSDYYTSRYSGEEIDAAIAAGGNPLILKKIYASVSSMNNDVSGEVATGEFAGIAPEDTADADYGKVYVKGASGWVYWATLKTIDGIKGPQGPAGPAGAKGADGAAGPTGPAGPANTLSIGTVTKGDEARAEITGTAPNQTLNLVLPKGDKGDRGEKGSDGVDGSKGDPGDAGPANVLTIGTVETGDTADATITGAAPAQVLNLVLPKGDRGDPGPEGPPGPKGEDGTGTGDFKADGSVPMTGSLSMGSHRITDVGAPVEDTDAARLQDIPRAVGFAVTLTADSWTDGAQTVQDARFVEEGYAYVVSPAPGSFAAYASAVIYADDITAAGEMTFHCGETPTEDLTVNILRTEAAA